MTRRWSEGKHPGFWVSRFEKQFCGVAKFSYRSVWTWHGVGLSYSDAATSWARLSYCHNNTVILSLRIFCGILNRLIKVVDQSLKEGWKVVEVSSEWIADSCSPAPDWHCLCLVVIQFTFQITISAQPPAGEREERGWDRELNLFSSPLYISDVYKM